MKGRRDAAAGFVALCRYMVFAATGIFAVGGFAFWFTTEFDGQTLRMVLLVLAAAPMLALTPRFRSARQCA